MHDDKQLMRRCLALLETWQAMEGADHCNCSPKGQCVWCDIRGLVAELKERLDRAT